MSILQPTTDKEWDADQDATTLMQAMAIRKNKKRLSAARKVVKAKQKAFTDAAKSI